MPRTAPGFKPETFGLQDLTLANWLLAHPRAPISVLTLDSPTGPPFPTETDVVFGSFTCQSSKKHVRLVSFPNFCS